MEQTNQSFVAPKMFITSSINLQTTLVLLLSAAIHLLPVSTPPSVVSTLPCLSSIPNNHSTIINSLKLKNTILPKTEQQLIFTNANAQAPVKFSSSDYQFWYSRGSPILIGYNFTSYVFSLPEE